MKKNKNKKKAPPIEAKEGTILLLPDVISEEVYQKMKKHFESLSCRFDIVIREPCDERPFKEAYFGPCQWCGEEIYAIDVCPDCGKMVDIS